MTKYQGGRGPRFRADCHAVGGTERIKDAEFITDQLGRVIEAIDRATVSAVAYGYSMSEMVYSLTWADRLALIALRGARLVVPNLQVNHWIGAIFE